MVDLIACLIETLQEREYIDKCQHVLFGIHGNFMGDTSICLNSLFDRLQVSIANTSNGGEFPSGQFDLSRNSFPYRKDLIG